MLLPISSLGFKTGMKQSISLSKTFYYHMLDLNVVFKIPQNVFHTAIVKWMININIPVV